MGNNMKIILLVLALLCTFVAQSSAQCTKVLGTLTERQFDNTYGSLFNKVDRELLRTGHYIYFANGSYAYVATASIDVTKLDRNVVNYTVCKINSIGVPASLQVSGTKLFLVANIYNPGP